MLSEMASVIGKADDAQNYLGLSETTVEAIRKVYRNEQTGQYCDGIQGADAYAIWAGLVKAEEVESHMTALAEKYETMGHFDTGFLGTDILAEMLMEYGYSDVLFKLLESEEVGSFLYMKRQGATTIWEDWTGRQSLCHPMFGGVVRQFFTGFLGIRQMKGFAGYENVEIVPRIPSKLSFAKGSIITPKGELAVAWKKEKDEIFFTITVPEEITAKFSYQNESFELKAGLNELKFVI